MVAPFAGYCTEADVRALTRTRRKEVFKGNQAITSTIYTLEMPAETIISVYKNGTLLVVTTNYTFTSPRTVTFVVALDTDDTVVVTYDTDVTSTDVTDAIRKGFGVIHDFLANIYTVPFDSTTQTYGSAYYPPQITLINSYLASVFLAERLYTTEQPNKSEMMMRYWDIGMKLLSDIRDNLISLTDINGTKITRKDQIRSGVSSDAEGHVFDMGSDTDWGANFNQTTDGRWR